MWRSVALGRTDITMERIATFIRVKWISEIGTTLAVTDSKYQLQLTLFLDHWFISLWWWRLYVPTKRRFLQEPHGVTSQKTAFFNCLFCLCSFGIAKKAAHTIFYRRRLSPRNIRSAVEPRLRLILSRTMSTALLILAVAPSPPASRKPQCLANSGYLRRHCSRLWRVSNIVLCVVIDWYLLEWNVI
jgi:hypothetical protein